MKAPLAVISADKEIIELGRELGYEVIGFFDADAQARALELPHLGPDGAWALAKKRHPSLKVALALDPTTAKRRAFEHYGAEALATLVSPHAHVSPSARVGAGCILQRGVAVMADAVVGPGCKINVGAVVHHDCRVGACCTIAPRASLLGFVQVGDGAFVGAAATIMPRVRIGPGAVVGAGALVHRDVEAGATVAGVPARVLRGAK